MDIDFSKLNHLDNSENVLDPREIFKLLRKDSKYSYLRDVQSEVLQKWVTVKDQRDTVLKMNTGSGKTTVGLLILKSCLNEDMGPAVYITPDRYLTSQVIDEAKALGIEVTDRIDTSFKRGNSIFVDNIHKLINGKSVFGVNKQKQSIGSIVIDDVHACLSKTDEQFTIKLSSSNEIYKSLLDVFTDTLKQQSSSDFLAIKDNDPQADIMAVPFWTWQEKIQKIESILYEKRDIEDIKFQYPLLKRHLKLCTCVFSGNFVEISPRIIPIDVIRSFVESKRRIFMSATLADSSILVSHFDVDIEAINNTLTPNIANDIGDRMILIPEEINPKILEDQLKLYLKQLSEDHNVVILVPSEHRLDFWQSDADLILKSNNLNDGIQRLKSEKVGLSVILNKYDGIDLGYDACRILVIDGIPGVEKYLDKVNKICLSNTKEGIINTIQKIEQGMGRGIRSNDDQCIVFLMGKQLINKIYDSNALKYFTPATKKQIELSNQITKQIRNKDCSFNDITKTINYSLNQNEDWLQASKRALIGLKYDNTGQISDLVLSQRKAFEKACVQNYQEASKILLDQCINNGVDKKIKGWLKQQCAEYINFYDPEEAQKTLKSGIEDNKYIIHPIEGINYQKLNKSSLAQAESCHRFLSSKFSDTNKFILKRDAIINNLKFDESIEASDFEESVKELGEFLGFESQRPDYEFKKGPDVLWIVGNSTYFLIECKNRKTNQTISKDNCNQLAGHINWFKKEYRSEKYEPIIIHPDCLLHNLATPDENMKIITKEKLSDLKDSVIKFCRAIINEENQFFHNVNKVGYLLKKFNLSHGQFVQKFTSKPRKS